MAISKDWYNTEFEENETESSTGRLLLNIPFYTAVKTGDMETVIQNCNADSFYESGGNRSPFQKPCHESEIPLCGYSCDAYQILH